MEKQNAFSRRSVKVAFVLFFCFRYLAAYDLWDRQAVRGRGGRFTSPSHTGYSPSGNRITGGECKSRTHEVSPGSGKSEFF